MNKLHLTKAYWCIYDFFKCRCGRLDNLLSRLASLFPWLCIWQIKKPPLKSGDVYEGAEWRITRDSAGTESVSLAIVRCLDGPGRRRCVTVGHRRLPLLTVALNPTVTCSCVTYRVFRWAVGNTFINLKFFWYLHVI